MPIPFASRCPVHGSPRGPKKYRATFQGLNHTKTRNRLLELEDADRGRVVDFTNASTHCTPTQAACKTRPHLTCFPCKPFEAETNCDLLNSTYVVAAADQKFAQTPRWLEALAAGAIPVTHYEPRHLHAKVTLPFGGVVDWEPCTKIIADFGVAYHVIIEPEDATRTRQRACWQAYDDHFSTSRRIGDTILASIFIKMDVHLTSEMVRNSLPARQRVSFKPPRGAKHPLKGG